MTKSSTEYKERGEGIKKMRINNKPKGETFGEAAERVGRNGEKLAKAIGGHIPERVLDDRLLKRR